MGDIPETAKSVLSRRARRAELSRSTVVSLIIESDAGWECTNHEEVDALYGFTAASSVTRAA